MSILKTITVLLFILFFSNQSYDFDYQESNFIEWRKDIKLKWTDFQGVSQQDDYKKAEMHGEIKTVSAYWENGLPKYEVKAYFVKDKAWTITEDTLTLQHEQIHFDILEWHTRLIRKSFDSLNKIGTKEAKVYQEVFNNVLKINDEVNEKYDWDVKFDRTKQEHWKCYVQKKLDATEQYYLEYD